jgi:hypothetical protein
MVTSGMLLLFAQHTLTALTRKKDNVEKTTGSLSMTTIFTTSRSYVIACRWLSLCLLGTVLLLPASGFCVSADSQETLEEAAEKAVEKVVEQAAEKAAEKATEKVVEQTAERAAEKAVEKVTEKAADRTAAEVVDKAAEKAVVKAAKDATAKETLKARRPDEQRGATQVYFIVFVLDVDAIDDANQSFMTNVYLRLRWKDRRLANPQGQTRRVRLEEVWNPELILANRQGLVSRSLPEVVQVDPDGTVTYRQRFSGMLSQPLDLADFPMDEHTFNVQFASAAYSTKDVEFLPDTSQYDDIPKGGAIAETLSLQDWKVLGFEALALPYQPIKAVQSAGFVFRFEAERHVGYYFWQVVLPLSVVVLMSYAGFWIQRGQVGVRIGVATSSILTMIAHRFVLASLLPRLPYMTHMDYFSIGCTLLVFMALFGVVVTSYLSSINRHIMAKRFDLWARVMFPMAFLALLGWFAAG